MSNSAAKKEQLNADYIVTKKQELYVIDNEGNRRRICVEYPIELSTVDVEDILMQQTSIYCKLDGEATAYVPLIKIQQRQKWQ